MPNTPAPAALHPGMLHPGVYFFQQLASFAAEDLIRSYPRTRPLRDVESETEVLASTLAAAAALDAAFADLERAVNRFEPICAGIRACVAIAIRSAIQLYEQNRAMPRIQNMLLLDAQLRGLDLASIKTAAVRSGILRGANAQKNLADRRTSTRRELETLGVKRDLIDEWINRAAASFYGSSAMGDLVASFRAPVRAKLNAPLDRATAKPKRLAKPKKPTRSKKRPRLTRRDRDDLLRVSPPLRANGRTASP